MSNDNKDRSSSSTREAEVKRLVEEAMAIYRRQQAIPPEKREPITNPDKYSFPVGLVTDDEKRSPRNNPNLDKSGTQESDGYQGSAK